MSAIGNSQITTEIITKLSISMAVISVDKLSLTLNRFHGLIKSYSLHGENIRRTSAIVSCSANLTAISLACSNARRSDSIFFVLASKLEQQIMNNNYNNYYTA
jgi:hypothetical protein